MKICPSCSTEVDGGMQVCPSCGHQFDEPAASSKTMMGLPSIGSFVDEPASDEPDPGKQTLFGFPAQKAGLGPDLSEPSDYEDYDESDATHLIPAAQLQAEFATDTKHSAAVENRDTSKTMAGLPAVDAAWGLNEEVDQSNTSVVPASALFGASDTEDEAAGFSRTTGDEIVPQHGTLMGMSVESLHAQLNAESEPDDDPMRSTQFAFPAVQPEDLISPVGGALAKDPPPKTSPELDTESGPISVESPTEMWNPNEDLDDAGPEHRELLKQLRNQAQNDTGTQRGVPAVKRTTDQVAKPVVEPKPAKPEPEIGKVPTPTAESSISKPKLPDASELRARLKAKREALKTSRTSVDPGQIPAPADSHIPEPAKPVASGVLGGKGTYMVGRANSRAEPEPEPELETQPEIPILDSSDSRKALARIEPQKRVEAPVDEPPSLEVPMEPLDSLDEPSDFGDEFAFADTNVAPRALIDRIQTKPSAATPEHTPRFPNSAQSETSSPAFPFGESPDDAAQVSPTEPGFDSAPLVAEPGLAPTALDSGLSASPLDSGLTPATRFPTPSDSSLTNPMPQTAPVNPMVAQAPSDATSSAAVSSDQTAQSIQVLFGALAGILFLAAAAIGLLAGEGLVATLAFVFAGFCGVATLLTTFFPMPVRIKTASWGIVGVIQFLASAALLVMHVLMGAGTPVLAIVASICAAMLSAIAAIFPMLSKRLS